MGLLTRAGAADTIPLFSKSPLSSTADNLQAQSVKEIGIHFTQSQTLTYHSAIAVTDANASNQRSQSQTRAPIPSSDAQQSQTLSVAGVPLCFAEQTLTPLIFTHG